MVGGLRNLRQQFYLKFHTLNETKRGSHYGKKTSESRVVAQKTIFAAFKILMENDRELPGRELSKKLENG